jgi:hypothetical protein
MRWLIRMIRQIRGFINVLCVVCCVGSAAAGALPLREGLG